MVSEHPEASPNPGDLCRRVRERREELGLTIEEVATRAGIAPGYLSHLEGSPATGVGTTTLRLAAALETTLVLLAGGGTQQSPGQVRAGRRPVLEPLSDKECLTLMSPGGIGRLGFYDGERGTVIIPVNYAMLGRDVVFRTAEESSLTTVSQFDLVGFEVDHLDNALSEGWSVLFSGHAYQILDHQELEEVKALGIEPWAGGDRDSFFRLAMSEVSGRRIRVQA